jgi:molybdopterin molybdotransferase
MDTPKIIPCQQFPMLDVDDAVKLVLTSVVPLAPTTVPLSQACGRIVANDITAADPFPAFNTSIMDGYAVHGPLKAGSYPLQERLHAGSSVETTLMPGKYNHTILRLHNHHILHIPDNVIYITTGSRVPPGANAVVKVGRVHYELVFL